MMAAVIALLIAVAVGLAYDRRVALIFIGSSVAVFGLLRLISLGVMAGARRVPRPRMTMLRLAIANIHRPGALTPSVVLSLGLGLTVLVTITQIDRNLQRQFMASAAGEGAVVLLRRHSGRRTPSASMRSSASRFRAARSSACRCCADGSSRRAASSRKS